MFLSHSLFRGVREANKITFNKSWSLALSTCYLLGHALRERLRHHRVSHLLPRHVSRTQTQVILSWALALTVPSQTWVCSGGYSMSQGREWGLTLMCKCQPWKTGGH